MTRTDEPNEWEAPCQGEDVTITYRCNQCGKDCGTKAKVTANNHYHFCSYRCTKLYYEKNEMLYCLVFLRYQRKCEDSWWD